MDPLPASCWVVLSLICRILRSVHSRISELSIKQRDTARRGPRRWQVERGTGEESPNGDMDLPRGSVPLCTAVGPYFMRTMAYCMLELPTYTDDSTR